jgi:hypothetical protein
MDCIDCHNRAAHTFVTAEEAIDQAMANGAVSPQLPLIHKEGLTLLKAGYASQNDAAQKIAAALEAFYRSGNPAVLDAKTAPVKAAGAELVTLYSQNVFPDMKMTWAGIRNNVGHMSYPGCFSCHDGDMWRRTAQASPRTAPPAMTFWPSKRPSLKCSPTWAFNSPRGDSRRPASGARNGVATSR